MRKEVKIGIFAVAMLLAAWAGIRFLSGVDIFGRNSVYYAAYDRVDGVQAASPIMIRGVKVGTVTGIAFDPARSEQVVLELTVQKRYRIPVDSRAKIVSSSLMGNKAIEIAYGEAGMYLRGGDTLQSGRDRDLMDMAGSELDFLKQKVSTLTASLERTLGNINTLLETNARSIEGTLGNLDAASGDLAEVLRAEKENLKATVDGLAAFSQTLGANAGRVDSILCGVNRIATTLSEEEFASRLTHAAGSLDSLLQAVGQGEGTLGRLVHDPALYESLNRTSDNLALLLADLKQYPGRYVHLSLFGRDPEKMKEKADRRAAKAAEKARRDSLKRLE